MLTPPFELLKAHIAKIAGDVGFIHHQWFVEHHLNIVEQISLELCDIYPQANRDIVMCLVWLHDLGKIITNKQVPRHEEPAITQAESYKILCDFGFDEKFSTTVKEYLADFESDDLSTQNIPIEVKIVSSADGCSHFVGPFYALYWYENPQLSVNDLIEANYKKLHKDWDKKIVLPEARQAFATYYQHMLAYKASGRPERYL